MPLAVLALAGCSRRLARHRTASGHRPHAATATGPACTSRADGRPPAKKVDLPPDHAAVSGEVPVTITTNAGDIKATLDAERRAVHGQLVRVPGRPGLLRRHPCHRLTTQGIYVLQCGDPTGTGAGGPGYSFADELSGKETYGPGTLAMANAGPDTNGSQFFMVYGDSPLPPATRSSAQIDDAGLKVVKAIADKGTADGGPDGAPKEQVAIELGHRPVTT